MAAPKRKGDIELGQDLTFQRREWLFERIGWLVMLLLVLAALLGLLGKGYLSRTSNQDPSGTVRVEYDRFLRRHADTELRVRVAAPTRTEAHVWVSREYLQEMHSVQVNPQPLRIVLGEDRHVFVFPLDTPSAQLHLVFRLNPDRTGNLSGRVGVGEDSVEVSHFVYP